MDEIIITQTRKKYKSILKKQREIIEEMRKAKMSDEEIIRVIGCCERTYRREIARGMCEQLDTNLIKKMVYSADLAQMKHEEKGKNKGAYAKINNNPNLRKFIENKIKKEKFSPDAALMAAAQDSQITVDITAKTLYNSIDRGDLNVTRKDLLRKEGWKQDKSQLRKGYHTKGKSIEERPQEANERTEAGHWEGDLVVSKKGGSGAILTLTERQSREEIIIKLLSKEQTEVVLAFDRLERRSGGFFCGAKNSEAKVFKSVTFDNGGEFLNFKALEKSIYGGKRFDVYYAHPYSSWERGTNENHNGIIRRFYPKGTDFSKVSKRKLLAVQNWMNNYPRRSLGGLSPNHFAG